MVTHSAAAAPQHPDSKRKDLLPSVVVENIRVDDLSLAKHQVRRTTNRQVRKCMTSIERFGFVYPILISGFEVADGATRLEAAKRLKMDEVPCIRVDHLSESEVRALRIALNKIQESGAWDDEGLKLELANQLEFNTDLTDLGFEPAEIDTILEIGATPTAEDPIDSIESIVETGIPVCQPGDIWKLGHHQIACGNARDERLIADLVGGEAARMIFTDPPYNVPINGHVRSVDGGYGEFAEASGELSTEEFIAFLSDTLGLAVKTLQPGGLVYSFMDWRHMQELQTAYAEIGLDLINLCVWVKLNGGMGSFYRSRHELVFVGKRPGAAHINNVQLGSTGRYRTNVWEHAGATGGQQDSADDFALHPTVKPIRLVEEAILDASAVGDIVVDPFLGSGTTLLAAERTQRRCIGIEIDPAYVDVTIRRWQEMTGQSAILQATGETFVDIESTAGDGSSRSEDLAPRPDGWSFEGEF